MVGLAAGGSHAGIAATQSGDPLPHALEGLRYRFSEDRVTAPPRPAAASRSVDEEEAEGLFLVSDVRQVRFVAKGGGELGPVEEDGFGAGAGAFHSGLGGGFKRRAEVRAEVIADGRGSGCHGVGCG